MLKERFDVGNLRSRSFSTYLTYGVDKDIDDVVIGMRRWFLIKNGGMCFHPLFRGVEGYRIVCRLRDLVLFFGINHFVVLEYYRRVFEGFRKYGEESFEFSLGEFKFVEHVRCSIDKKYNVEVNDNYSGCEVELIGSVMDCHGVEREFGFRVLRDCHSVEVRYGDKVRVLDYVIEGNCYESVIGYLLRVLEFGVMMIVGEEEKALKYDFMEFEGRVRQLYDVTLKRLLRTFGRVNREIESGVEISAEWLYGVVYTAVSSMQMQYELYWIYEGSCFGLRSTSRQGGDTESCLFEVDCSADWSDYWIDVKSVDCVSLKVHRVRFELGDMNDFGVGSFHKFKDCMWCFYDLLFLSVFRTTRGFSVGNRVTGYKIVKD